MGVPLGLFQVGEEHRLIAILTDEHHPQREKTVLQAADAVGCSNQAYGCIALPSVGKYPPPNSGVRTWIASMYLHESTDYPERLGSVRIGKIFSQPSLCVCLLIYRSFRSHKKLMRPLMLWSSKRIEVMKIIRLPAVMKMTGLARSTVYKYIAEQRFPKQIKLGARAAGWLLTEVEEWIEARVAERD